MPTAARCWSPSTSPAQASTASSTAWCCCIVARCATSARAETRRAHFWRSRCARQQRPASLRLAARLLELTTLAGAGIPVPAGFQHRGVPHRDGGLGRQRLWGTGFGSQQGRPGRGAARFHRLLCRIAAVRAAASGRGGRARFKRSRQVHPSRVRAAWSNRVHHLRRHIDAQRKRRLRQPNLEGDCALSARPRAAASY